MMKKEHARTAILREWLSWARTEKITGKAKGFQAMKFYTFLQTQRSHLVGSTTMETSGRLFTLG